MWKDRIGFEVAVSYRKRRGTGTCGKVLEPRRHGTSTFHLPARTFCLPHSPLRSSSSTRPLGRTPGRTRVHGTPPFKGWGSSSLSKGILFPFAAEGRGGGCTRNVSSGWSTRAWDVPFVSTVRIRHHLHVSETMASAMRMRTKNACLPRGSKGTSELARPAKKGVAAMNRKAAGGMAADRRRNRTVVYCNAEDNVSRRANPIPFECETPAVG